MDDIKWSFSTLEECLDRKTIRSTLKCQAKEYKSAGTYPIIDQGQEFISGWTDDPNGLVSDFLPLIVFGDHTRIFKFIDFPFVRGADGTQLLKPRQGIDPFFFFYACKALDIPNRGYNRHFSILKKKTISLPPQHEQIKIAKILSKIESCIDIQKSQLKIMLKLKSNVMHALFTNGLQGHGQKETEIGLIPKNWTIVPFSSIRQWLQYGTSIPCTEKPQSYPVLRIPNIEPGRVIASNLKYCDLNEQEASRYLLEDGDFLFIRTNGVIERLGSCAVYSGSPSHALFASYLIRARLRRDIIEPKFAAYFFASPKGINLIASSATPAADGKYNLNTGTIDALLLPLPPSLDEQCKIIEILDSIDKKIDIHKQKQAVFETLFKTVLHKLIAGEVRVNDLDLSILEKPVDIVGASA
jgi:type I restriction enzyme, S subunit